MTLIDRLGGRKAVALWSALLVVLLLLLANQWILPDDLERARMVVQEASDLLKWALAAFVGGNAAVSVAALIKGKPEPDGAAAPPNKL